MGIAGADDGALESAEADTEWQEIEVGLEAAGGSKTIRVLVSKPETLAGRVGYDPKFINGWNIPLPAGGIRARCGAGARATS